MCGPKYKRNVCKPVPKPTDDSTPKPTQYTTNHRFVRITVISAWWLPGIWYNVVNATNNTATKKIANLFSKVLRRWSEKRNKVFIQFWTNWRWIEPLTFCHKFAIALSIPMYYIWWFVWDDTIARDSPVRPFPVRGPMLSFSVIAVIHCCCSTLNRWPLILVRFCCCLLPGRHCCFVQRLFAVAAVVTS